MSPPNRFRQGDQALVLDGPVEIGATASLADARGAIPRTFDVWLTQLQLDQLHAAPVTVAAAPGAGRALVFEGALIFKPGSVQWPYTLQSSEDLVVRYTNGAGTSVGQAEATGVVDVSGAQTRFVRPYTAASGASDLTPVDNAALVLHNGVTASALTTTAVTALTTTQIAAYSPPAVAALTTTQMPALTTTQLGVLSVAQIQGFETTDLGLLNTTQIASLSTTQLSAFTSVQAATFTTTQLGGLNTTQVAALSTDPIPTVAVNLVRVRVFARDIPFTLS